MTAKFELPYYNDVDLVESLKRLSNSMRIRVSTNPVSLIQCISIATGSLLAAMSGCTLARIPLLNGAGNLSVSHVMLQGGPLSGFPVTDFVVCTAAHAPFGSAAIAAVDGKPARICDNKAAAKSGSARMGSADWVALCVAVGNEKLRCNKIRTVSELIPGSVVILGGFPRCDTSSNANFWDLAPTLLAGQVVRRKPLVPDCDGLAWVELPAADYRGISGGPVAIVAQGEPVVIGMVVRAYRGPIEFLRGATLLGVLPLPESVGSY